MKPNEPRVGLRSISTSRALHRVEGEFCYDVLCRCLIVENPGSMPAKEFGGEEGDARLIVKDAPDVHEKGGRRGLLHG